MLGTEWDGRRDCCSYNMERAVGLINISPQKDAKDKTECATDTVLSQLNSLRGVRGQDNIVDQAHLELGEFRPQLQQIVRGSRQASSIGCKTKLLCFPLVIYFPSWDDLITPRLEKINAAASVLSRRVSHSHQGCNSREKHMQIMCLSQSHN